MDKRYQIATFFVAIAGIGIGALATSYIPGVETFTSAIETKHLSVQQNRISRLPPRYSDLHEFQKLAEKTFKKAIERIKKGH